MKKFRLLLAAMLAFVFNSGVWAQQFVADGDTYEVISGTNECRLVKLAGGTRFANLASSSQVYNQSNSKWYTFTTISGNIVADCKTSLEWIAMPSTLKYLFKRNDLAEFESPFLGCTKLETVNMSNCTEMTMLYPNVFEDVTSLEVVSLPSSLHEIPLKAFGGCTSLKSVNLDNITKIESMAFYNCQALKDLSLSGVEIEETAFYASGLQTLSLTNCKLNGGAITGSEDLVEVTLINCTLDNEAFSDCYDLQSVTLNSIGYIPPSCFEGCVNLKSITLPESVCYIGKDAFYYTGIKDIYCMGDYVISVDAEFYKDAENVTVHVPCGFTSRYKAYAGWRNTGLTFKESGNLTLKVSADMSDGEVAVKLGDEAQIIPQTGGELTMTMEVPESISLLVPPTYFDKVLINGDDVTNSLPSVVRDGYKWFTISEFSATTNIHVKFADVPFMTNKLTFFFIGNESVNTTFQTNSIQSYHVEPGLQHYSITHSGYFANLSTIKVYFATENKPIVFHGSNDWSDKLTLSPSQTEYKLEFRPSEITSDVFTVSFQTPIVPDDKRYIDFADNNVKTICINNWDTNRDGKLSIAEAAAVTSIGTKFTSNTTITSFDELQYFTSLTTLDQNAFSGCNKLTSIKFPSSLKTIKASAFQMCTSLKNITLPEGLEFLSGSTFVWCSEMTRLLIPGSVTSITGSPMIYSPNVSSIVVDDSNGNYDSRNGCNAIISTSTNELIAGCKNTIIPEDVVSIGVNAFFGNSGLTSIVLPSNITDIGDNAFNSCSSLEYVICKMTTPPNIMTKSDVFSGIKNNCVLIVPAGKKEAYINAGWTTDIFKGGIVEAKGDKLIALLVPSNGGMMSLTTSTGAIIYGPNAEAGVLNLNIGGNYVLLVDNPKSYYYDLTLYVNGVDRTSELVLDDGWYKLNLDNVTEDIHAKAVYTKKLSDFAVISSIGGTTQIEYTTTSGVTRTVDLSSSSNDRFYCTEKQLGTDVTLTLTPDEGYEIGLVYTNTDLAFSNDEGGIQDIGDGKYKVVMPPLMVDNSIGENMVVIFKKTGTNPNYDVNGDGSVTITDAVLIVNEILGQ